MQVRHGWLVLIGLLLVGALLGWWLDSAMPSGPQQSQVDAPAVDAPSNDPTRNAIAANVRKRPDASTPAGTADPMEDPLVAQCSQDYREAIARHLPVLANRDDAQSKLGFALLAQSAIYLDGNGDQINVAAAYAQARRLAPDNPLVAWLAAKDCRATTDCDPDAAIAHLSRLEPDNAAIWLIAMDVAQARGDVAAVDRYLARAAQADYYDLHFGEIGLLAEAAMEKIPTPDSCSADVLQRMVGLEHPVADGEMATLQANGVQAIHAMPPLQGFLSVCRIRDSVLPAPSRLPSCAAVLSLMAQSDTLIAQSLGLGLLVRYAGDQPEGAQLRERLRNLRWLMAEGWKQFPYGRESLHALWVEGEVPTLRARLTASSRWPAPPGWLPQDARSRALITTGRPPRE